MLLPAPLGPASTTASGVREVTFISSALLRLTTVHFAREIRGRHEIENIQRKDLTAFVSTKSRVAVPESA